MLDRIPTKPGRIKLYQESADQGTSFWTMERADAPTVEGTPLNKLNLFNGDCSDRYGCNVPSEAFLLLGKIWNATILLNNWSENKTDGYYTNRVTIEAMKSNYNPIIQLLITSASEEDQEKNAFSKISKAETDNGSIIFYAKNKPTINLNVSIKGV